MKQLFMAGPNRHDRIEQLVNPEVNQGVTCFYDEITARLNENFQQTYLSIGQHLLKKKSYDFIAYISNFFTTPNFMGQIIT